MKVLTKELQKCYHCGSEGYDGVVHEEKWFCCEGCKQVYELIEGHGLGCYYALGQGNKVEAISSSKRWDFLQEPKIRELYVRYSDGVRTQVEFYLPQMHCKSCIYLLENLGKLNSNVLRSEVDFLQQRVRIYFEEAKLSLEELVGLLSRIGYEPYWGMAGDEVDKRSAVRQGWLKTGLAGISFAIVMMLSLPEYLAWGSELGEAGLETMFRYMSLFFGSLAFFYSASEIYVPAWKGLRKGYLHIDAPIFLSLFVTYSRSVYEVISGVGSGYLDSMSGIIFLLLLGRQYQSIQKQKLAFDKSYLSFFPLGVRVLEGEETKYKMSSELEKGDIVVIGSGEVLPCDGVLLKGHALVDYHFVTGEAETKTVSVGEVLYAGGKQRGGTLWVQVVKPVTESFWVQLWGYNGQKPERVYWNGFTQKAGRYFGLVIILIALVSGGLWYYWDSAKAWHVFTSCLIVACPCSLFLASQFTYGFGRVRLAEQGLFMRNGLDMERLSDVDTIVFDKTGTLIKPIHSSLRFEMTSQAFDLNTVRQLAGCLSMHSSHPMSKAVYAWAGCECVYEVEEFQEHVGQGVSGWVNGYFVQLGSAKWLNVKANEGLYLAVNGKIMGRFLLEGNAVPEEVGEMLSSLRAKGYALWMISGDSKEQKDAWATWMDREKQIYGASPMDKLTMIEELQRQGKKVLFIGDGLNDMGALRQADYSMVIVHEQNLFAPYADAMMREQSIFQLPHYLKFAGYMKNSLKKIFGFSLLYNVVGIGLSVSGLMHPLFAAALMMTSSFSIIGLGKWLSLRKIPTQRV